MKNLTFAKIQQINKEAAEMYTGNKCTTEKQYKYCLNVILKRHKVSRDLYMESSMYFSSVDDDVY